MKNPEPEFIPGAPLSQECLDSIQWMRDKIWRDMVELCRIPKELLYPNGKAEETKAKKA